MPLLLSIKVTETMWNSKYLQV